MRATVFRLMTALTLTLLLCGLVLFVAIRAVAGSSSGSGSRTVAMRVPYNVLLIVADDVSQWQIDTWSTNTNVAPGYVSTPNLDDLAAAGITFDNFFATPLCGSTRAQIMTGRYTMRTQTPGFAGRNFVASELTIPDALADVFPGKYVTAAFGEYGITSSNGSEKSPGLHGFDKFWGAIGAALSNYLSWTGGSLVATSTDPADITLTTDPFSTNTTYVTDYTTDSFITWYQTVVAADPNQPWFAWVNYHSPHSPVHNPARARDGSPTFECDLATAELCYQAQIEDVDAELGEIITAIDADLYRTLVCWLGDNGAPSFVGGGGKGSIDEIGVNVGMICGHGPIVAPGRNANAAPGAATDLYGTVDLLPTILDAAGRTTVTPPNHPTDPMFVDQYYGQLRITDGISMWPVLRNEAAGGWGHAFYVTEDDPTDWAVRWNANDYKYVRSQVTGDESLYNLPDESTDLNDGSMTGPEQTAFDALKDHLDATIASVNEG